MIKNIFIPERIGSYYIWGKKVVGIDIGATHVHATLATIQGRSRTIEKVFEERIETEGNLPLEERIISALKIISARIGRFDEIRCVLPSSVVVFKELTLPFIGLKKIKMVIPFEVESLLPFTLDQAVIDSIITREDRVNKQTDVIVAAVKTDIVAQYVRYFHAANLKLDALSVDMFELYGLYTLITPSSNKTIALVDLGMGVTRVAVLIDNQLKYIRSIPRGLLAIAKKMSTVHGGDPAENLQQLLRIGVEPSEHAFSGHAQEALNELLSEIKFTAETFTQKIKAGAGLDKIVLTGVATDIPGIEQSIKNNTALEVQLLKPKQITHASPIKSKVNSSDGSYLVSMATALCPDITADFTLLQEKAQREEDRLINYQLISIASIVLALLFSFSLYSFLRVRNLRSTLRDAEAEAINELKKTFKLRAGQTANLAAANKAALAELKKQELAWRSLSAENRYSFLRDLTELSRCINLKEAQLQLTSLTIRDDTIKLYGSVPGYQQLTKLQSQLECPLFKKLPKLQDWNFKSEPITLIVQREEL